MKESFRQSMSWLHVWGGLIVGWILFFIFLTGTLGYLNSEIDLWMRPEQPFVAARETDERLLTLAQQRLGERAPDAALWQVLLPGRRGSYDFSIQWRAQPGAGTERGASGREVLDLRAGAPSETKVRGTGGGTALYIMHYALHYMPALWAYYLVGICTMVMLVAILTGVVAHRRIFRDFFTFRLAKGPRTWLDAHNLLGVTALPFHLMIAWSGLVFFVFTYMPLGLDILYPNGEPRLRFASDVYGAERQLRDPNAAAATLVPLASLLPDVERRWGAGKVERLSVYHVGRANAEVVFLAHHSGVRRERPALRFNGVTGDFLGDGMDGQTGTARFNSGLLALHEGRFAGPFLRFLYVAAGLIGTAMIGTGLMLWSAKRKTKLRMTARPTFGLAVVDTLNLGTIIGLPIGIAAYFWANRVLPVDMAGRAAWEIHVMFIAWGLTFLYATLRPLHRSWVELCWLAAASCAFLPLLNALTTDRNFWVSIQSRDWVFVGFDLSALAAGAFFAGAAQMIRRKQRAAASVTYDVPTTRIAGKAVE